MKDEQHDSAENSGKSSGTRRGRSENLRPWPKGVSGNPGGRPRKQPISDAYSQLMDERLPEELRLQLKLRKRATWAHALAFGQVRSAIKGNTHAAKEVADRVEGRTPLPVKLDDAGKSEIKIKITIKRLRETNG